MYMYVRCTHPEPPFVSFLTPLTILCPRETRRPHPGVFCVDCFWLAFSFLPLITNIGIDFLSIAACYSFYFWPNMSLTIMFPVRVETTKKSLSLHHYKFQAKKIIEHIRIFYTFFIPFTNNFSNYFKSLTPFVKAFFVSPTCQDKSSPSLSIDSIAAPKTLDCFFFLSFFKMLIIGLD